MAFYIIAGGVNNGNNRQYMSGDFLIFDSATEQNVTLTQDVTSYPIEGGSNISDNVSSKNDLFRMTGYVSNCVVKEHQGNAVGYGIKRTEAAVAFLRKLKEEKTLITVATEFEALDNCVLTEISYSQTAQNSEALPFVLSFERLRFAEKKYVTLDVSAVASSGAAKDASKDAKSTTAGGSNKTKQTTYVQDWANTLPKGILGSSENNTTE